MRNTETELKQTTNFSLLDRETVFTKPDKPNSYFIRAAVGHCANGCNHVCVVSPNKVHKRWDVRWLINEQMNDADEVVPVGRLTNSH